MGQTDEGMYLVETVEDVAKLQVANPDQLAYVSQTTLSVDDTADIIAALKRKFPAIIEPKKGDICYATTNRQEAVKFMAPQVEVVIVVGSPNSSNSNRLREVAEEGHAGLHGRQRQPDRSGMAGRQAARGRDRRRLGAGSAGAGRDRPPEGIGRAQRASAGGRGRKCHLPVAERAGRIAKVAPVEGASNCLGGGI
jgi:hypothetical protein